MLNKLKPWRAWIFGGLVLVALVWIVESSQSFQSCVKETQYQAGDQSLKKRLTDFSVLLRRRQNCLGALIHRNEGAIAALATFLIALFTLALWQSTERLWEATRNTALVQERDTRILQRAYLAVEPLGVHVMSEGDRVLGHVGIKNAGNLSAFGDKPQKRTLVLSLFAHPKRSFGSIHAICLSALVSHRPRDGSVVSSLHCMNDPQAEGHMASYIRRRKFLAALGGAAAGWPLAAGAQ
jgi:hypothetical protein